MRVSKVEMDKSHARIVRGAAKLMRARGIDTTSVNDVMIEAGLTHGGFYRHFESKEALVSAALEEAFEESLGYMEKHHEHQEPATARRRYRDFYLSTGHVRRADIGCPIAALAVDIARAGQGVKDTFRQGFERVISRISRVYGGTEEEKRTQALREIALLAGAVMIARASGGKTAEDILAACEE